MRHYVTFVLQSIINIIQQLNQIFNLFWRVGWFWGFKNTTNFVSQSGENLIVLQSYMRKYKIYFKNCFWFF